MNDHSLTFSTKRSVFAAAAFLLFVPAVASAQGRPSTLDRRLENEKQIRDTERLRRGMEVDSETRTRSKEERKALVDTAFMRLQVLHNDIMSMTLAPDAPDASKVVEAVAETRKRAGELRANLVLPDIGKNQKKDPPLEAVGEAPLKEALTFLCALIKSFVLNINESGTNKKAAEQARRELDRMITLSDRISARLSTSPN